MVLYFKPVALWDLRISAGEAVRSLCLQGWAGQLLAIGNFIVDVVGRCFPVPSAASTVTYQRGCR